MRKSTRKRSRREEEEKEQDEDEGEQKARSFLEASCGVLEISRLSRGPLRAFGRLWRASCELLGAIGDVLRAA